MSIIAKSALSLGLSLALLLATGQFAKDVSALEVQPNEKAHLKACERDVCSMIVSRKKSGADVSCAISKTWAERDLKSGESKGLSWFFGDARCDLNLRLNRAQVVGALTQKKFKLVIPMHTVNCVVERNGKLEPVTIRLSPKIKFKKGKAKKAYIRLRGVSGPSDIKSTIETAATLEDKLGIFHRPLIKAINKFIHKQCPKKYSAAN